MSSENIATNETLNTNKTQIKTSKIYNCGYSSEKYQKSIKKHQNIKTSYKLKRNYAMEAGLQCA